MLPYKGQSYRYILVPEDSRERLPELLPGVATSVMLPATPSLAVTVMLSSQVVELASWLRL